MGALRYSFYNFFLIISAGSFLLGQGFLWFGYVFLVCMVLLGDWLTPHDLNVSSHHNHKIMNLLLYTILPLQIFNMLAFNWQFASADWFGVGAWIGQMTGIDVLKAREERSLVSSVGAVFSMSFLLASAGTTVAHELVHRTWNKFDLNLGRWILAFTCDTSFSIEHVYGHHANIGTYTDPSTSRRGESVYAFLRRSTVESSKGAWRIEAARLHKRSLPLWSRHNRFLSGQVMTLTALSMYAALNGWLGILLFFMVAAFGKMYLEVINYIEHYGIVRPDGAPVEARHSWNCNHRFSCMILYYLPRHSHHHARGNLPFWHLKPMLDAPTLPYGYMAMLLIALVPPLYRKIMEPYVLDWEQRFALPEEQELMHIPKAS